METRERKSPGHSSLLRAAVSLTKPKGCFVRLPLQQDILKTRSRPSRTTTFCVHNHEMLSASLGHLAVLPSASPSPQIWVLRSFAGSDRTTSTCQKALLS